MQLVRRTAGQPQHQSRYFQQSFEVSPRCNRGALTQHGALTQGYDTRCHGLRTTAVNFATALDDKLGVSGAGSAGSRATATLNTDVHPMIDGGQLNHIIAAGSADSRATAAMTTYAPTRLAQAQRGPFFAKSNDSKEEQIASVVDLLRRP